jgi:putative protease
MEAAVNAGADAVYLAGPSFGMRAAAGNFTYSELQEAVKFIKSKNKKIYITVNIFARNHHIEFLKEYLLFLNKIGPHALITADTGIYSLAREIAPGLSLHLSTQANTCNYKSVEYYKNQGFSRVNLARELTYEEIGEIRKTTTMELEIFIHGSMCVSYSGRCLLSAALNNRSANLGDCTQPCRWPFKLVEQGSHGTRHLDGIEEKGETRILSSKDLCLIKRLPHIIEMGIDSLKIEGRMKSLNYVASATAVYRQAIDLYCSRPEDFYKALPKFQEELEKSDNRGFTEAFFSSSPAREIMNYSDMNYFRNYSTLGVIKRIIHKKWALLEVKAQFTNSDVIEYLAPDTGIWVKTVLKDLRDLLLEPVDSANSGEYIMIPYNKSIPIGTIFRISKTSNFTK